MTWPRASGDRPLRGAVMRRRKPAQKDARTYWGEANYLAGQNRHHFSLYILETYVITDSQYLVGCFFVVRAVTPIWLCWAEKNPVRAADPSLAPCIKKVSLISYRQNFCTSQT